MTQVPDAAWFDRAPCGLVSTNLDGVVVGVNDTMLRWTGLRRDELVAQPFTAMLDGGSRLFFETRHRPLLHLHGTVDEVSLTLRSEHGAPLSVLINAARDDEAGLVRFAIFNATDRVRYETELLQATRTAERSEQRVRILQEVSTTFGVSATDEDVARSFATVARDAFSARHTAVFLIREDGELVLSAGTNPLAGKVAPVPELRRTDEVTIVHSDDADFPHLATAMRHENLASLSVAPLVVDQQRLGVLVCFFAGRTEFDLHYFDLQKALARQASQTLQRVRLQRQLALLALHDQLTGAANRQLLQATLDDALATAATSEESLAVLFLDIDEFKSINDEFGHAAGDEVLKELATRLRASVRAGDTVGRIGGDEFVAICPGADVDAAAAIAQRILGVCREPITVSEGIVAASVSVGISVCTPDDRSPTTAQQLLVRADAAMYDAKRSGKNRVIVNR